jgi:general secretion pathway protein G
MRDPARQRHLASRPIAAGFTLIEMIVVLAIIATLAAVIAPSIFRNVGDAKTSAAKSQIHTMALALDAYRLDNDHYPSTEQGLTALRAPSAIGEAPRNWRGPYLQQTVPDDPWGRPFQFVSPGRENSQTYDLYSLGRDGKPGGVDEDSDITSWGGPVHP